MNSSKRIFCVLITIALWFSFLQVFSFAASMDEADGSDATGFISAVVGSSGTGGEIPAPQGDTPNQDQTNGEILDGFVLHTDNESQDGFVLRADKTHISLGESSQVIASFSQTVESNAAILTCSYNPEEFEYQRFEAGEGIHVLDVEEADGEIKITCMASDYQLNGFGSFSFGAKTDRELYGRECTISATAEYVVFEGNDKVVRSAFSETKISLAMLGDVNRDEIVNLLDISDLIDYFGMDVSNENWNSCKWYDFNENGSIDIFDIVFVARIIEGKLDAGLLQA